MIIRGADLPEVSSYDEAPILLIEIEIASAV